MSPNSWNPSTAEGHFHHHIVFLFSFISYDLFSYATSNSGYTALNNMIINQQLKKNVEGSGRGYFGYYPRNCLGGLG
jgi:hypothetical protein